MEFFYLQFKISKIEYICLYDAGDLTLKDDMEDIIAIHALNIILFKIFRNLH